MSYHSVSGFSDGFNDIWTFIKIIFDILLFLFFLRIHGGEDTEWENKITWPKYIRNSKSLDSWVKPNDIA